MLGLRFKVGPIMYISFDCCRPRSPSWSSWITTCFSSSSAVCHPRSFYCPHTNSKLCDFYPCTSLCHVIYAKWSRRPSHALLRHLWPYLPIGICLSLSISWRLDPFDPSRPSMLCFVLYRFRMVVFVSHVDVHRCVTRTYVLPLSLSAVSSHDIVQLLIPRTPVVKFLGLS